MLRRGRWLGMAAALGLAEAGAAAPLAAIDLQARLATASPWRFVAWQGPDMPDPVMDGTVPGPIALCLSRNGGHTCVLGLDHVLGGADGSDGLYGRPHYLEDARVVRAAGRPLLWLVGESLHGGNGNQLRVAVALAYRPAQDRFVLAYRHLFGRNTNDAVRLVNRGPIAGAIVSADPTRDAPFGYWITVDRLTGSRYTQRLRFRSSTRYGDGNPLAVIDSEMPNILHRLGLWRPGRPLPVPDTPCAQPHLVRGALWCGPLPVTSL